MKNFMSLFKSKKSKRSYEYLNYYDIEKLNAGNSTAIGSIVFFK